MGETSAICDEAKPEEIHVIYCDAEVQGVQQFGASERLLWNPKEAAEPTSARHLNGWKKNDVAPFCLIYLTGLWCRSYTPVPEYPVLWVTELAPDSAFWRDDTDRPGMRISFGTLERAPKMNGCVSNEKPDQR